MEEGFRRDAHDDLEHSMRKHTQLLRDAEPVLAAEDVGVPVALADSARPCLQRGGVAWAARGGSAGTLLYPSCSRRLLPELLYMFVTAPVAARDGVVDP